MIAMSAVQSLFSRTVVTHSAKADQSCFVHSTSLMLSWIKCTLAPLENVLQRPAKPNCLGTRLPNTALTAHRGKTCNNNELKAIWFCFSNSLSKKTPCYQSYASLNARQIMTISLRSMYVHYPVIFSYIRYQIRTAFSRALANIKETLKNHILIK